MTQPLDIPNVADVTGQLRTLKAKYHTDLAASASLSTRSATYRAISACGLSLRNCGWRCRRLGTC